MGIKEIIRGGSVTEIVRHGGLLNRGLVSITSRAIVIFGVSLIATGCAMEGDFGRPHTSIVSALTEPVRLVGDITNLPVDGTDFALTPDEERMREVAFRLRAQVHNLRPMRWTRFSEVAYAEALKDRGHNYGPSRLATINHELRADRQALNRFAEYARRVFSADQRRIDAVTTDRPFYTTADNRNARGRVRQNCTFIEKTFIDLAHRIETYEYAIDRARIETPDGSAEVVADTLADFRDQVIMLNSELMGAYKTLKGPRRSKRRAARDLYGDDGRRIDLFRRNGSSSRRSSRTSDVPMPMSRETYKPVK